MRSGLLAALAAASMATSLSAHAQLTSVDNGAAAIDGSGLMWANTVGTRLSWSSTGDPGSAQAWIASLNAGDYGGYNDWSLASGNGSLGINTTTDQLGELFYSDCGNSAGQLTVLNNAGRNCTALSALNSAISPSGAIFFSSSLYGTTCCNIYTTYWWMYQTPNSNQGPWNFDASFNGRLTGDALAVRKAPEIDPASASSGLTLLLGGLMVLLGRRTASGVASVPQ